MHRITLISLLCLCAAIASAPVTTSEPWALPRQKVTAEQARSFAAEVQEAIAELEAVEADPKEIERLEQVRDEWLRQSRE
jgi:hypothetical protein